MKRIKKAVQKYVQKSKENCKQDCEQDYEQNYEQDFEEDSEEDSEGPLTQMLREYANFNNLFPITINSDEEVEEQVQIFEKNLKIITPIIDEYYKWVTHVHRKYSSEVVDVRSIGHLQMCFRILRLYYLFLKYGIITNSYQDSLSKDVKFTMPTTRGASINYDLINEVKSLKEQRADVTGITMCSIDMCDMKSRVIDQLMEPNTMTDPDFYDTKIIDRLSDVTNELDKYSKMLDQALSILTELEVKLHVSRVNEFKFYRLTTRERKLVPWFSFPIYSQKKNFYIPKPVDHKSEQELLTLLQYEEPVFEETNVTTDETKATIKKATKKKATKRGCLLKKVFY